MSPFKCKFSIKSTVSIQQKERKIAVKYGLPNLLNKLKVVCCLHGPFKNKYCGQPCLNDPKLAKTSVDKCNIELVSPWYTENLEQSTAYDAIKINDS